jgi:hypothetical protein
LYHLGTQSNRTKTYTLDPTRRILTTVDTAGPTLTNHYTDNNDNPAWIGASDATWTRTRYPRVVAHRLGHRPGGGNRARFTNHPFRRSVDEQLPVKAPGQRHDHLAVVGRDGGFRFWGMARGSRPVASRCQTRRCDGGFERRAGRAVDVLGCVAGI